MSKLRIVSAAEEEYTEALCWYPSEASSLPKDSMLSLMPHWSGSPTIRADVHDVTIVIGTA